MTYLHDYVEARKTIREDFTPKMLAAIMPVLDRLGLDYVMMFENHPTTGDKVDALRITGEGMGLPDGYRARIDFYPDKNAEWKAPADVAQERMELRREAGF